MSTTQRDDDVGYESDPEETKRSLVMRRRRAASDEEEDRAADGGREEGEGENVKHAGRVQSDESDGEGAAAEYDEDEYYSEGEEEEGYGEVEVGYREERVEVVDGTAVADEVVCNERVVDEGGSEHVEESVRKEAGDVSVAADVAGEWGEDQGEEEEEENLEGKKENEPYAVPNAGAFYMHDDRFRDNVGGRNRYEPPLWVTISSFLGISTGFQIGLDEELRRAFGRG